MEQRPQTPRPQNIRLPHTTHGTSTLNHPTPTSSPWNEDPKPSNSHQGVAGVLNMGGGWGGAAMSKVEFYCNSQNGNFSCMGSLAFQLWGVWQHCCPLLLKLLL